MHVTLIIIYTKENLLKFIQIRTVFEIFQKNLNLNISSTANVVTSKTIMKSKRSLPWHSGIHKLQI